MIKEPRLSQLEKSKAKAWYDFRLRYMTEEEKQMSKEDWLDYYDKVVANEKLALYSAPLTIDFMKHSLELTKQNDKTYWTQNMVNFTTVFTDTKGNVLPVTDVLVINPVDLGMRESKGALGMGGQFVMIDINEVPHVMVQLRNGDAGYIPSEALGEVLSKSFAGKIEIPVKVIPKKIGRVGVLRDLLKI